MKIALMLCGSFYPIHIGHVNLLLSAKKHYEQNKDIVTRCIICPTHFTSLSKKFGKLEKYDDNRLHTLQEFLDNYPEIMLDLSMINAKTNTGIGKYVKIIQEHYSSQNIKLVQICGVDSKIKFVLNNQNAIIVDDGRDVPDENKSVIKNTNVIKSNYNLISTSSTIERFLNQEKYPSCTIKQFDPLWLKDTGITLGNGVQGVVRLMYLGTLEVAVKIVSIDTHESEHMFYTQCKIAQSCYDLNELTKKSFLKIYHYEIINNNFGYIVCDVGIPLNKIINVSHSYQRKTEENEYNIHIENLNVFLQLCGNKYVDYEHTNLFKIEQTILQSCLKNKTEFKINFCSKLFKSVSYLEQNKVYHRDLHYDNILLNFTNELHVLIIDFNVSKKHNSLEHIKRGSMRYYPIDAINNMHHYEYLYDKYMASFIMYELIEEHEIYPECQGDTRKIIKLRKNKIFPDWTDKSKNYFSVTSEINKIWLECSPNNVSKF